MDPSDDIARLLLRLARPGMTLRRTGATGATPDRLALIDTRQGLNAAVSAVPSRVFAAATAAGWLVAGETGWQLAGKGRQALKRIVARRNAERSRPKTAAPSPQPEQNPAESPLTWLRRHKSRDGRPLLSEAQYHAGERLRADFWRASMTPRITMSWSATPMSSSGRAGSAGRGVEFSDAALAAQERVRRALASVGPELAGVLIDVCCHLKGLEQAERSEGWPLRSAKVVLLLALTSLARHYGYIAPETAEAPIARRLRHWATSDYRPGL